MIMLTQMKIYVVGNRMIHTMQGLQTLAKSYLLLVDVVVGVALPAFQSGLTGWTPQSRSVWVI